MISAGVHSLSHSPVIQAASSFSSMAPSRSVLFNFVPVKCRLRGVSRTTCVGGGGSGASWECALRETLGFIC